MLYKVRVNVLACVMMLYKVRVNGITCVMMLFKVTSNYYSVCYVVAQS